MEGDDKKCKRSLWGGNWKVFKKGNTDLHRKIGKRDLRRSRMSLPNDSLQQWRQLWICLSTSLLGPLCCHVHAADATWRLFQEHWKHPRWGAPCCKQDEGMGVWSMEGRKDLLNGFYCCVTAIWEMCTTEGNSYLSPFIIHHPGPAEWPCGLLLSKKAKRWWFYGCLLFWCVFPSLRKQIRWLALENRLSKSSVTSMCWYLVCPMFIILRQVSLPWQWWSCSKPQP